MVINYKKGIPPCNIFRWMNNALQILPSFKT